MSRSFLGLLGALSLLASSASAQVIYTYQGPNFDTVVPPYTTSMSISGTFELAQPLPVLATVDLTGSVVAFSFFDGVETRDQTNTDACQFSLTTDAGGRIVDWWLVLAEAGGADPQHFIELSPGNNRGSFATPFATCAGPNWPPIIYGYNAAGINGVWGGGAVAAEVPASSHLGLMVLAGVLLSAAMLRLRASRW